MCGRLLSILVSSPVKHNSLTFAGDHKNSNAFWAALKVQPIIQSGVQTWKALIVVSSSFLHCKLTKQVHKVMQEGHKSVLYTPDDTSADIPRREAANQTQWFDGIIRTVRCVYLGVLTV